MAVKCDEVQVLGPVQVVAGAGEPVTVRASQEQVFLAALVLAGNEAVSSGRLIDVIWGDEPTSASAALKALVHRVRRRHGRHLIATATSGYQLGTDVETDYRQAVELLRNGDDVLAAGDPGRAIDLLTRATALFRGDPPAALASTTAGLALERSILELRARVRDLLVDARLATGAGEELIAELEAAVEADPLAERNWERLMVALYRSGRQAAALGAFQRAHSALVEGAGLEPGPALRAIEQRIIEQDPTLLHEPSIPPHPTKGNGGVETALVQVPLGRTDLGWFHAEMALAGRTSELATVTAVIAEAVKTRSRRLVLISGDAGMGKSRLAGEAAALAALDGAAVIYGSCDPGLAAAYRPFAMAMDRFSALYPGALAGPWLPLVARIAPTLRDHYHLEEPTERAEPDDDRRVHAAYTTLLAELAGENGLVLVVDDCHWASAPTIALLRHLATDPTLAPVTVIATYRPRDLTATSPLFGTLAELHRNHRCTPVNLGRLHRDDLHTLITGSAGHDVPAEVTDRVHNATGGNPYLVMSTLRHLTDADLIVRRNQRWELTPGALDAMPAGIRHLISQQIADLPSATITLLQAAAVVGLTFSLDVTATVADLDSDTALDSIEIAALAGLVHEDGFDRWRWDHDLARSVVAEQLSTTRRVQTHWRTAQTLARLPHLDHDDIAHHATEGLLAAPADEAARLLASAAQATIAHDPAAALTYTETAVEALTNVADAHLHVTVLCLRAIALLETVGEIFDPQVVGAASAAEQASLSTGDPDLIVRAHTLDDRYPGYLYTLTSDARHIAACRRALDELPETAVDQQALILSHLVELHRFAVSNPGRDEFGRRLIEILDGEVSAATRAHIQRRLEHGGLMLSEGSPLDDGGRWQPPDLRYFKLDPHDETKPSTGENILETAQQAIIDGDLRLAEASVEVLLSHADGQKNSVQLTTRACLAVIHSARGDLDGLDADREWLNQFIPNVRSRALYDEALRGVVSAIAVATATPSNTVEQYAAVAEQDKVHPMVQAAYRIAASWLAAATGDHDTAQRYLDILVRTDTGLSGMVETTALFADVICRYRPDLAAGLGAHEQLAPLAGKWLFSVGMSLGPVDLYLAKLAHASGDDYSGHLHDARRAAERAGATFWLNGTNDPFDT